MNEDDRSPTHAYPRGTRQHGPNPTIDRRGWIQFMLGEVVGLVCDDCKFDGITPMDLLEFKEDGGVEVVLSGMCIRRMTDDEWTEVEAKRDKSGDHIAAVKAEIAREYERISGKNQ